MVFIPTSMLAFDIAGKNAGRFDAMSEVFGMGYRDSIPYQRS
jgi:hypothetical protein